MNSGVESRGDPRQCSRAHGSVAMIASTWNGPRLSFNRYLDSLVPREPSTTLVSRSHAEASSDSSAPTAAGKTTSMRILATLELPSRGDAFIEGLSSVNDPDRVRARLGFMPDNFGTYADTNCAEYLDFFGRSYGLDRPRKNTTAAVGDGFHGTWPDGLQADPRIEQRNEAAIVSWASPHS